MYINEKIHGRWIMYLRKSRADSPDETVEEVLAKHEIMLQEYAVREWSGRIPEENIYREVVSGESIADRIEIKKVISQFEDPNVRGVLVVEPQRLSRGDLLDCGQLINALRFSNTLVATLTMTYDLNNKMERRFFQDELLRGNDYLEYTKEILMRGKIASVKRGNYIGRTAPYGYRRIKDELGPTLEPDPDEAPIVSWIFDAFLRQGLSPNKIALELTRRGVPPRKTKDGIWHRDTVRRILKNDHYIGMVHYRENIRERTLRDGQMVKVHKRNSEEEIIRAKGRQPGLVSIEDFETVQRLTTRQNRPCLRISKNLVNPYAGLLRCGYCGRIMLRRNGRRMSNGEYDNRYFCDINGCNRTIAHRRLNPAIVYALENSELPALEEKLQNGDGKAAAMQKKLIEALEAKMESLYEQEEKQFELLETGQYTNELFQRRHEGLRAKMEATNRQLVEARANMPEEIDYEERIATLREAIEILKADDDSVVEQTNAFLKTIIDRIEYRGQRNSRYVKDTPYELKIFLKL